MINISGKNCSVVLIHKLLHTKLSYFITYSRFNQTMHFYQCKAGIFIERIDIQFPIKALELMTMLKLRENFVFVSQTAETLYVMQC